MFDAQLNENEASAFQIGYNSVDVNGDLSSDIFDMKVVENNIVLFFMRLDHLDGWISNYKILKPG